MPDPQNNSNDLQATDKRETIDSYRVSPELPLHRYAENRNEMKTPTRPFPYQSDDAGMKTDAVDSKGDGLPDNTRINAKSFPRVRIGPSMLEDNKSVERKP